MTASDNIRTFIKEVEGFKLKAYKDTAGVWTIGTGATYYEDNTPVKMGDLITVEKAERLFNLHLKHAESWVSVLVKKPLNQNQFDALVSFLFNFGAVKFKSYTLRTVINDDPNNFETVGKWWNKYVFSGGKKTNGLVTRRAREFNIYRYGKY